MHAIWALFQRTGLKNIPVVDNNYKPIGVINVHNVLKMLLEDAQYDEKLLFNYVMGLDYR